jgi:hypothetical protein
MGNFFLEAGFLCSQNHPLFDNKYKVYEFKIHFLDLNSKIVSQFDIWLGKNSEWWAGQDLNLFGFESIISEKESNFKLRYCYILGEGLRSFIRASST